MVEKGIRGGIYNAIHRYANVDNKYIKIMIKIENYHIGIINNLYGWSMSQQLSVDGFK